MSDIESFDKEFNRTEESTVLQPAENAEKTHVEPAAPTAENENPEPENKEPETETKEQYKERTKKQFETSAALQAEFGDFDTYNAYMQASDSGAIKIIGLGEPK